MRRDIRVVIVEDDPFARNWMVLLAVRDWRTRVIGELGDPAQLIPFLTDPVSPADFILLDTDLPGGEDWIPRILDILSRQKHQPKILCTGIRPNAQVLRELHHPAFGGYILKDEIGYSLAWAASLAIEGTWVITDSIQALAAAERIRLPHPCVVLEGRHRIEGLSQRQADVARLAFLFSIERRELADELGVGEDWGYQLVSAVYENMGIKDILADDELVHEYFGSSELILSFVERIRSEMRGSGKSKDMETLAFHVITMPEIREVD
jgi:DNA-binding NarL/FixJ family response regulator